MTIDSEEELSKIPAFYATENIDCPDKIIHMHFFIGSCDWFAAEYDPKEQLLFGFVILNGDVQNSEWGYFSLREMCEIKVGGFLEIDRDLHFTPRKAKEIERIREACGWQ
jgi:hypothetical protein